MEVYFILPCVLKCTLFTKACLVRVFAIYSGFGPLKISAFYTLKSILLRDFNLNLLIGDDK